MDIFDKTVASYCAPEGAEAYREKERLHFKARNASAYPLLDGMDLKGLRMLDVGCGYGRDVAYFRAQGADAYGCDISPALLDLAEPAVRPFLALADIRDPAPLPFGGPFDAIWCAMVLVHVPAAERKAVLGRLWAAVKPGGRLLIITKGGEGQRVMTNLGEALPRVMVYVPEADLRAEIEALGGEMEVWGTDDSSNAPLPTGDWLIRARVRKL